MCHSTVFSICYCFLIIAISSFTLTSAYGPYGNEQIRGVNLGSWLVLEKWITPKVFAGLPDSVKDEYTLCEHLGYKEAQKRLKSHWDTWVNETEIAELKKAGINHLRLPIGYWALKIPQGEPWVSGSWDYVMKAVGWAKKYGMKVMIDLHGAPGSQNGQDHSGRAGKIGFYYDDKNLELASTVLGMVAKTFNDTKWRNTVSMIQLLNEPNIWGDDETYKYKLKRLKQFYRQAYDEIRKYNDIVVVAVHDAFISRDNWYYLRDDAHYYWIMLDTHYYQVFNDQWKNYTCDQHYAIPCTYAKGLQESNSKLWTVVGEWSLATPNRCDNQGYFARQQIGVYEKASGWFMWNFKHGQGWKEWDFLASYHAGWINLQSSINAKC